MVRLATTIAACMLVAAALVGCGGSSSPGTTNDATTRPLGALTTATTHPTASPSSTAPSPATAPASTVPTEPATVPAPAPAPTATTTSTPPTGAEQGNVIDVSRQYPGTQPIGIAGRIAAIHGDLVTVRGRITDGQHVHGPVVTRVVKVDAPEFTDAKVGDVVLMVGGPFALAQDPQRDARVRAHRPMLSDASPCGDFIGATPEDQTVYINGFLSRHHARPSAERKLDVYVLAQCATHGASQLGDVAEAGLGAAS